MRQDNGSIPRHAVLPTDVPEGNEVCEASLDADWVASLPLDLVRHDLVMHRTPIPDDTLTDIVDCIFLPPVLADSQRQRGRA